VAVGVEAEEKLAGGVRGALGLGVGEGIHPEGIRQIRPQRGGQVGHFIEGGRLLLPHPVEDLSGAECWMAAVREPPGEAGGRQAG
jgi:hypothetical protein